MMYGIVGFPTDKFNENCLSEKINLFRDKSEFKQFEKVTYACGKCTIFS